jgi:predicted nuclease of predicted toxin-antitoxin system
VRFKLDENLGIRTVRLFLDRSHDVATVHGQGMGGTSDQQLYAVCVDEDRVLVTLDLDFANPFRFDPAASPGIAVFRVSETPGLAELAAVTTRLLDTVVSRDPRGRLWVVDLQRVREYRPADPGTEP